MTKVDPGITALGTAGKIFSQPRANHLVVNPANNNKRSKRRLTAFCAAWREEDVEVVLAILPPLELVEHAVGERPEALRASV